MKRGAIVALVLALWLVPVPRAGARGVAALRAFIGAIGAVVVGAFPILTASVLAASAAVLTGAAGRQGLRGVLERHDPADRGGVPRRARRGEVRARRAARPPGGEPCSAARRSACPTALFLVDARDRAGVPEQHGPFGRALPARALARRGRGRRARRPGTRAARRAS